MNFRPTMADLAREDSCYTFWRISQNSCWAVWNYLIYDPNEPFDQKLITVYNACNDDCCARQFEVCRFDKDSVHLSELGIISFADSCEGVYFQSYYANPYDPSTDSIPCYFTCDFLEDIDEGYRAKNIINNQSDEIEREIINNKIYCMLNISNSNHSFNIRVAETNASNLKISIYDITGNLLMSKTDVLIANNWYSYDISSFNSGNYLYQINIDGVISKTGIFSILK